MHFPPTNHEVCLLCSSVYQFLTLWLQHYSINSRVEFLRLHALLGHTTSETQLFHAYTSFSWLFVPSLSYACVMRYGYLTHFLFEPTPHDKPNRTIFGEMLFRICFHTIGRDTFFGSVGTEPFPFLAPLGGLYFIRLFRAKSEDSGGRTQDCRDGAAEESELDSKSTTAGSISKSDITRHQETISRQWTAKFMMNNGTLVI